MYQSSSKSPETGPVTAAPAHRISGILILGLAMLSAVAPLSIDMYLPGFPRMATDLGTNASGVQLTMTAFLVGMALGQLFIGPISDGIGRRKPLLIGTAVGLVATIVCALAPTIELFTAARFLQGLGGAAGVVLARAVVSDTARGAVAAKLFSVLLIITVLVPVLAPLAGGAVIVAAGWPAIFWLLALLFVVVLVISLFWVKETLPREERTRGGIKATLRATGEVLGNRNYTGYLLTFTFGFAALFAYISASPFIMQNIMGLDEGQFSLMYALIALAITASSAVSAGLAGKVALRTMIRIGLILSVVASAALLLAILNGVPTVATLIILAVLQLGFGLYFGNSTALTLEESGHHAGTGSAFLGFLQFALAAAVAPLVGIMGEDSALPMGIAVLGFIVLSAIAFFTLTVNRPTAKAMLEADEDAEAAASA